MSPSNKKLFAVLVDCRNYFARKGKIAAFLIPKLIEARDNVTRSRHNKMRWEPRFVVSRNRPTPIRMSKRPVLEVHVPISDQHAICETLKT